MVARASGRDGEVAAAEAAFGSCEGAFEQATTCASERALQGVDAAAAEQGGVDLEGGILGGGADETDGAALDVGQEGVLLGLVEAVDLIDKEDSAHAEGVLPFRPRP